MKTRIGIYIKDYTPCFLNDRFALSADNLKIFINNSIGIDLRLFQDDLDSLAPFYSSGYLKINVEKCEHIIFTKNRDFLRHHFHLNVKLLKRFTISKILQLFLIRSFLSLQDQLNALKTRSFIFL